MEGAIKLLKFCMEQKEAGNNIFCSYSPHVNLINIWGYKGDVDYVRDPELQSKDHNYYDADTITPERADEIINEIKEKLK